MYVGVSTELNADECCSHVQMRFHTSISSMPCDFHTMENHGKSLDKLNPIAMLQAAAAKIAASPLSWPA